MSDQLLVVENESARAALDLQHGGRLSSLIIKGQEILVTADDFRTDPMAWGAYPMVPWAGRVRDGAFSFDGDRYQLPITMDPHAIHGTAYIQQWSRLNANTIGVDLNADWPFGGSVTHQIDLDDHALTLTLSLTAGDKAMPAMVGWHPWFRRVLADGLASAKTPTAELDWQPGQMYSLDDVAIPTGELVAPPEGPWDNCFIGLKAGPTIRWPGQIEVKIDSDCSHWVIYTEPRHALCVEPQSSVPDAFNLNPDRLEPGESLTRSMTISWIPLPRPRARAVSGLRHHASRAN